jgi:hypothetical protein
VPIVLYYIDNSKEADLCNEWLFNPYDAVTVRQHIARTNETARQFFRGALSGEMLLGRTAAFRQGGLQETATQSSLVSTLTRCRCPTAAGPQNAIAEAHSKFAGLCKQGGFWPDRIAHVLAGPSAQHYAMLGSLPLQIAFQQRQILQHSYKALLVKAGELHKTATVMIKNGYDNKASLARSGSSVYNVQLVNKHGASCASAPACCPSPTPSTAGRSSCATPSTATPPSSTCRAWAVSTTICASSTASGRRAGVGLRPGSQAASLAHCWADALVLCCW